MDMGAPRHPASKEYPTWSLLLACATLYLVALACANLRFSPWQPHVWFGDDLFNYLAHVDGQFPSHFTSALTDAFENKYRPIFHLTLGAMFQIFGTDIHRYLQLNWLLHGLNAVLAGVIAWQLSQRSMLVTLSTVIVVATSRFALYQTTQVTGWIEGLSLTTLLMTILFVVKANSAEGRHAGLYMSAAVLSAIVGIHIHERYIVVFPWLLFCMWMPPMVARISTSQRLPLSAALLLVGLGNFAIRSWALDLPYFMGTGHQQIKIDATQIMSNLGQGLLSLMGFNKGPEHLTAAKLRHLPAVAWLFAITFTTLSLGLLTAQIKRRASLGTGHAAITALPYWSWLMLGVLLLAPAFAAIRMEQRWLLAPQICLILMLSKICGDAQAISHGKRHVAAFVVAALSIVSLDTLIAKKFDRVFFVYSANAAQEILADLTNGRIAKGTSPLTLQLRQEHCHWTLDEGEFFRIYGTGTRPLVCVKK